MTPPIGSARAGVVSQVGGGLKPIPDSGLAHRFDATQISGSDGDNISSWTDQEGSNNLTQATSSNQPTLRTSGINSKNTLEFDGSDDLLRTTWTNSISEPFEIYMVFSLRSTGTDISFFDGDDGLDHLFDKRDSDDSWRVYQGASITGGTPDSNAHIAGTIWRTSGNNDVLRLDGSQTAAGDSGTVNSSGLTVAARNTNGENSEIDIAEVLVYNDELTSSERTDLETTLSTKWGIAI